MSLNVLVVEDEPAIRQLLSMNLEHAGFRVTTAADASDALRQLQDRLPGLVLIDWMLPGSSGLALARQLRREDRTRGVPIIMLTARGEEADKIAGLEAGADDYVTKPFSPRELVARIRAVLRRRAPEAGEEPIEAGGLRLEPATRRAYARGAALELGPTEFRLLHYLMSRPERVHTRAQLLDKVWGDQVYVEERTVDVHIRRLRKALAPAGLDALIQTTRGAGYRFYAGTA